MSINALRGHLSERGLISARGREGVSVLMALVEAGDGPLDALSRSALLPRVAQLRGLHNEIAALDRQILAWHRGSEVSQRRATIPGIGVLNATALAASLGDGSAFHCARQLAAWLGLVPRQNSTGGKARLGRITKQGNAYLRRGRRSAPPRCSNAAAGQTDGPPPTRGRRRYTNGHR